MSKYDQEGPYDILTRRRISPNTVDLLAQWSDRKLFDLLSDLRRATAYTPPPTESPFNFVANDSLSGRAVPLATREQRLERVTQLARFAALYADTLLIRDPFEDYPRATVSRDIHGTIEQMSRDLEPSDFSNAYLRQKLIDDVRLVLSLRPLFSAGLLGFTASSQHWCPSCIRSLADRGELHKLFSRPDEIAWQRRVAKIARHLEKLFIEKGKTLVHSHGDHSHAFMFLPRGVLEYDRLQIPIELPESLAKKASEPRKLGLRDARKLGIFVDEIARIVDDISAQNVVASSLNCQYITDRGVDIELMDLVSNQTARTFNSAAVNALSHPLAFVDNVPLDRLLKLRANEGEAFSVYRDSVRQVLNNAHGKSSRELREAFEDQIRPELNKLELTIKNNRKLTALSTLTDVTVLFAAISIAAFSGLLPGDLIPRDILDVGAMLGGWQGVKGLASKLSNLRSIPKEAADNRFAFLWRIQRQVSKQRRH